MSLKLTNLEAILAVDSMNGLAKNEKIPWKSKTDMMFFKSKTIENTVIMGSKTLISLPNSQPLANRTNIVITNQKQKYSNTYNSVSNLYFLDLEETLHFVKKKILIINFLLLEEIKFIMNYYHIVLLFG